MAAFIPIDRGAGRYAAALEWGLDGIAAAFLPVVTLAPHGTAPLVAVGGVLALGVAWPARTAIAARHRMLAALFAALVAWAGLSVLWAVDPAHSLVMAARLGGLFAAGVALSAAAARIAAPERLLRWFAAGLAVAIVLALVQFAAKGIVTRPFAGRMFTYAALNQVENSLDLVVLPLVAVLLARGRWALAGTAAAATGAVILLLRGDAGHLALALGAAGAVLVYLWRRPAVRVAAVASVVLILAAPLVLPALGRIDAVRESAQEYKFTAWHRLEIWSFVGSRIAERPVLGWGLDSSRAIPGGDGRTPEGYQLLPLHPHNAALQLWLELGLPGAVLAALVAARIWLALGAAPWPRLYAAAAAGSLTAGFVVALGAYGLWAEWWISAELLALFVILVMGRIATTPAQAL